VLHIACHAQFRSDNPHFSALNLADGALTAHDAARLRLRCELLALSACETGVAHVLPGNEPIGLTYAFLSAGAPSVLASLWTVQDEVAADFMARFYERLRADRQPARALRETQIAMLSTHPHPYAAPIASCATEPCHRTEIRLSHFSGMATAELGARGVPFGTARESRAAPHAQQSLSWARPLVRRGRPRDRGRPRSVEFARDDSNAVQACQSRYRRSNDICDAPQPMVSCSARSLRRRVNACTAS
jgi:hypothetical protein